MRQGCLSAHRNNFRIFVNTTYVVANKEFPRSWEPSGFGQDEKDDSHEEVVHIPIFFFHELSSWRMHSTQLVQWAPSTIVCGLIYSSFVAMLSYWGFTCFASLVASSMFLRWTVFPSYPCCCGSHLQATLSFPSLYSVLLNCWIFMAVYQSCPVWWRLDLWLLSSHCQMVDKSKESLLQTGNTGTYLGSL